MATVNADGALMSTHITGPFGEQLPNQPIQPAGALAPSINPVNTADGTTNNYVGQHQKLTDLETSPIQGGIIQMGARPYIPTLGRFISVDPVDGAGDNAYSYVNDPVNHSDLDGRIAPLVAFVAWQLGRVAVQHIVKVAVQHAAKQAVQQVAKKATVEATKKVVQWSAGKPHNAARNAASHYSKHARDIGAKSQQAYTNSARNTIQRSTHQHKYQNGRTAHLDARGRIAVVNGRGNIVSHFKPKHPYRYWNNNIKGR